MPNIKDFLIDNKQTILKHAEFESLFKDYLSIDEVTFLSNEIFQQYMSYPSDIHTNLYNYTCHVLCSNQKVAMLSVQCTTNNVYIQYQCVVPSIHLDKDTIVYYIDNNLYLTKNNIIIATGSIDKNSITWSNIINLYNDCYMKLPTNTILPDDSQILPTLVLNNLSQDNQNT